MRRKVCHRKISTGIPSGGFFADRVFGPGRAALLAAQLPATDAAAAADRDAQEAALKARIARIEAAQNAKILELEDLPANPGDPAGQAYRSRSPRPVR